MKATALRDFASCMLGNVSVGDVVDMPEKQFAVLSAAGLVEEYPVKPREVMVIVEPPPVVVVPAVVEPEPLTDERQELLAKAEALGIKVDQRWSNKRLRKVVMG